MLWEWHIISQDVGERSIAVLALEGCSTEQHLVDEDPESPPIHRACMSTSLDDLRCDILLGPNEGIRSEVRYTGLRVDCGERVRVRTVSTRDHRWFSTGVRLLGQIKV